MKIFRLKNIQYQGFLDSVRNYLSNVLSGFKSNYGNNTVFGQLINVLADVVQSIMMYIEDALTEQNKYTAQRKKSIWNLAQLTGYNPSFGKTATAQISINFIPNNSIENNIIINNKEKLICTQNGLPYNIILSQEAITLSPSRDNSVNTFNIVEGAFEKQHFIAAGGKLYTQGISFNGNTDPDYLEVRINNELWEQRASLYDMDANANQFTYKPSIDGKLILIFGNDVHGKSLSQGDTIDVSYLVHDGEYGNIDTNDPCDFSFSQPLSTLSGGSVIGDNIFNIRLTSNDAVSSGTNSETIEEVRQMIGLNSRSLVLADANNYKNFINKFSFCGYNRTWSERGSLIVNSLIIKNYQSQLEEGKDYFNLRDQDFYLTENQKSSILNCIEASGTQLAGSTYRIYDPILCKYAATMYIKLKNSKYDTNYISNQIRNLVGEFFCNVENDMFIPKSDIINIIKNNIPAVDGVDLYFLSERNEHALKTGRYDVTEYKFNLSTGTYDKKTEHIALMPGENPNIGLDKHGNILIDSDEQFPVLMGGWEYKSDDDPDSVINISDPLIIIFE